MNIVNLIKVVANFRAQIKFSDGLNFYINVWLIYVYIQKFNTDLYLLVFLRILYSVTPKMRRSLKSI